MAEDKNRDEQADLKRREYHDKEGEIHHHTHPYMEEHGGERGHSRSSANDTATAERKQSGSSSESGGAAHPLTDHDEIRRWAEARDAKPACVRGTGGKRGKDDPGMIGLDFPGWSGAESLAYFVGRLVPRLRREQPGAARSGQDRRRREKQFQ